MGSPFLADHGKRLGRAIDSFLGSKTAPGLQIHPHWPHSAAAAKGTHLGPEVTRSDSPSLGWPFRENLGREGELLFLIFGGRPRTGNNQALCYRLQSHVFWKQRSCGLWLENRERRNKSSEGLSSTCPSVSICVRPWAAPRPIQGWVSASSAHVLETFSTLAPRFQIWFHATEDPGHKSRFPLRGLCLVS